MTMAFVVGYIVIAQVIGIVFLGIAPALMAYNAVKRQEPLRWVAVAAAALSVFLAANGIKA